VAAFLGWAGWRNHLVVGQLFRHFYVVGDQRHLDTNVASASRNRRRAIVDGNGSVRLGQRGRKPTRRVSSKSLRCSKRSAGRSGWCSAITLGAVGQASQSITLVIVFLALAGFFLGVASSGLIAPAPLLYSTAIRSTGVGWAMGLGRFGSFVGPLAIGLLVNRGWQVGSSFVAIGAPALCAALFTSLIGTNRQEKAFRAPLEKNHQQQP
jgi:MFS family permease